MRIPLDIGKIYDYYRTSVSNDQIIAIQKTRFWRKDEMDGSYISKVSVEGPFFF